MDKDYIDSLLHKNDLISQIELIDYFIIRALEEKMNKEATFIFQRYLSDLGLIYSNPFKMIGPKKGLSCYVAQLLSIYLTIDDFNEQFKYLNEVKSELINLIESKTPLLKMTSANELLEILDVFGAKDMLTYNKNQIPIRFFFIPFENTSVNATYFSYLNFIVIYRINVEKASFPEYVFMHEIGHIIQRHFSAKGVPSSFMKTIKGMFGPASEEDLAEIFADCFSIAVMHGTPYQDKNPFFKFIRIEDQLKLKKYFIKLCNS